MVKLPLNMRGLEKYFSHNSHDIMTGEKFQTTMQETAEKHGLEPQDFFDRYLTLVTGRPAGKYTEDDVVQHHKMAVEKGLMTDDDVILISQMHDILTKQK